MFVDFLRRLKQRNVFRVAGLYAVTGYAVFQIANNLLPALNLPRWSVSLVAVLFLLGFPIVMIVAYAFEKTDTGFQRVGPPRLASGTRLGWFDWTLLGAIALVAGIAIAQFAGLHSQTTTPDDMASRAMPEKSIAVLPFVNFGTAADDDHFADGLTEELINGLAQLPDLRVAGRTSAFYFKGRNEDLREVGRKLGVAHVLEGSVRRSGNNLRITAQLIKVNDGFHLWSKTYDQPWSEAFAIQTQISESVAKVLQTRLLGVKPAAGLPAVRNPRAYEVELIARSHLRKQTLEDIKAARTLYQEMLTLEPDNAHGYIGYAEATVTLAQNHLALDFDEARRETERALEKALQLDPQSSDAWRVQGLLHRVLAIRAAGGAEQSDIALAAFRRAVELDPRNSEALAMLAGQLVSGRQTEQAISLLRRALEMDPLSRNAQRMLGTALRVQGKLGEARRQLEGLVKLYPEYSSARISLGELLMEQGRLDEAVIELNDPGLIRDDPLAGIYVANCYANLGMQEEMKELLLGIKEPPTAVAIARAALLLRTGRRAEFNQFAAAQLAQTRDPIWRAVLLLDTVLSGNPEGLRGMVDSGSPELKRNPPAIGQFPAIDALMFASALRSTGDREQAARIADAVLKSHEAAPGEYNPIASLILRAQSFAVLGDVESAIGELQRAERQGYRSLIDIDYFVRLDEYPFMAQVVRDPRYKALALGIQADNARMRGLLRTRLGAMR